MLATVAKNGEEGEEGEEGEDHIHSDPRRRSGMKEANTGEVIIEGSCSHIIGERCEDEAGTPEEAEEGLQGRLLLPHPLRSWSTSCKTSMLANGGEEKKRRILKYTMKNFKLW